MILGILRPTLLQTTIVLAVVATTFAKSCLAQAPPRRTPTDMAIVHQQPVVFVENRGQWDGDFTYRTRLGPMTVFLEQNGWTFTIVQPSGKRRDSSDRLPAREPLEHESLRVAAVTMHFSDGARARRFIPNARTSGIHNYFLGSDRSRWRTDLPLYREVLLADVWPGIDVGARIADGHFEYDLVVSPGAELGRVSIEVNGARELRLDSDGDLLIETELGLVRQPRPRTWQVLPDGRHDPVQCEYVLCRGGFRFETSGWDTTNPLTIDPGLIYSTYLGGSWAGDVAWALDLDPTGAATVAGQTPSADFPTTPGAYDTSANGAFFPFVTRFSTAGSSLVYSTFFGGNSDVAYAVAVDSTGAATVGGAAYANFPTTPGAYQTTFVSAGCCAANGFVTRFTPSGNALVYSTYLGGASHDEVRSVVLAANGDAIVAGVAGATFPIIPGAFDSTHNGVGDAFVARLNAGGNALLSSTFLGGTLDDLAYGVALDASGAITVAGLTISSDYPTTPGAYDTSLNSTTTYDAFVTRLNPAGSSLIYSTFLGGPGEDVAYAVEVNSAGAATVAGRTSSSFPTTTGAYDTTFNGGAYDGFVAQLNAAGTALVFSTFLGGSGDDQVLAMRLDAGGGPVVAGRSASLNFPTTAGAYDTTPNGLVDAFVGRLDAAGSTLVYSTLFGGSDNDLVNALRLDASGTPTLAGKTWSTDLPTTPGAYDPTLNGGNSDCFVARLQLGPFGFPLMSFPAIQSVPVGKTYGLEIVGPPGAPVALMFDPVAQSLPVPPYGTIGLAIPPAVTFDGIGLGFTGSIPASLSIDATGFLYFSYNPVPTSLIGTTFHAQAVAVDVSFIGGVALSTHGNPTLPTPACQVTFVP